MRRFLFLILSIVPMVALAQYRNPLDLTPSFAGNFAEVRSVSFHAGLDFKTAGAEGKKVYAAADGYVSRVAVSPWGYGKVVYITHPALGSETVYAHLSSFAPAIDSVVKAKQYSLENYRINLYINEGRIPVKKGDLIALSGNTGSSGGPHVHFEVRENGLPVNSLAKGYYSVADTIPPRISNLYLIQVDTVGGIPRHSVASKHAVVKSGSEYRLERGESVKISGASYFAFDITDRKNGVTNTFGTYSGEVRVEGSKIFGYRMDRLSYTLMKYVNTLKSYPLDRKLSRSNVIRAYISPNNKLKIYEGVVKRGVVLPSAITTGECEAIFYDDCGNSSKLSFTVEVVEPSVKSTTAEGEAVEWCYDYHKSDSLFDIEIASGTLFESDYISSSSKSDKRYNYSDVVSVGSDDIPIAKPYTLRIKPSSGLDSKQLSKAIIVSLSSSGGKSALTTTIKGGMLECKPTKFGRFTVDIDNSAPKISPMYNPSESQSSKGGISFKITDDLSGIDSFSGYVDGKWVLFEYEPKSNRITYNFDSKIVKGGMHTIKVVVSDSKGNSKTYEGEFKY